MQRDIQKHKPKIKKYNNPKTHVLLAPNKCGQRIRINFSKAVQQQAFLYLKILLESFGIISIFTPFPLEI